MSNQNLRAICFKEDWKKQKLGEVCEKLLRGGDMPKNNFSKFKTEKYSVPIFSNGEKNKGLQGYTDIKKVEEPSVTISAVGTIGIADIREGGFYPAVRLIVLIPKKELIELNFLKYVVQNTYFQNIGSSTPQLTIPLIRNYEISFPKSLREQKAISKILSSLDSKIESNKMTNKILEDIGKEIFKRWFDGENNTIPAKDVIDFKRGVEVGSGNYLEIQEKGTIPFYRVADVKDINADNTKTFVKKELLQDGTFNNNDVLVSFDGTVGRVFIGGQGGYSSGIRKLIIKKPNIYKKQFAYFWAKSSPVQRTIKTHATGTIILHAGKGIDFLKIQSNQDLIKKFNDASLPLFQKILNNILEIQTLSKIRDLLLPKLMRGKIMVPVGEK